MTAIRFPRSLLRLSSCALALGALLLPAGADVRYVYAFMDGAQVLPPVPTSGTGEAIFVLNVTQNFAQYEITYQNLSSPENDAHIHGPANTNQNGGVLHSLPLGTPKVGLWFMNPTQVGHVLNELTYTNIHTNMWPGGELRGQNLVTARGYCFGDGTATACPCGNSAGPHEGCANRTGTGARLRPAGFPTANGSELRFIGDNLIPSTPALLFVGDQALNSGNGSHFGDGLRCAGINVVRLGVKFPDASGRTEWGPGLDATGGWSPGDTRRFQVWYRDPPPETSPCNTGFNLSNGVEVTFQ